MSNFETWWEREGQEFLFALNTTTDDDIKLVAEIAWKNGAYYAEQQEQKPVAWIHPMDFGRVCETTPNKESDEQAPLYAAPVRTKDLTDDEIFECYTSDAHENTPRSFARAVIAADRSKNK